MDKYKWDLRKIFKNEKEFFDAIDKIKENLYSLLELQSQTDLLIDKVYVYAYLSYYSDTANNKFQEYKNVAGDIYDFYASSTSFINPEIQLIDSKKIEKLISDDKRLSKYEFLLSDLFRYKKHILSEKEETLLKIYKDDKQWPGNLNLILTNFGVNVDNRAIPEQFGEARTQCRQVCQRGGRCRLCYTAINFSKALDRAKDDWIPSMGFKES